MNISTHIVPLPQGHRSSFAADARIIRRLGAQILAELLPLITAQLAARRTFSHSGPALGDAAWLSPKWGWPDDGAVRLLYPQSPAASAEKGTNLMQAYRTESPYYFSSRQLMAAGSLVFFSEKLRRYVHPTAGILFDPHPRLQVLSKEESQELTAQWREALARY